MAITKKRRAELVRQYSELVKKSEAIVIASYTGLQVKGIDQLRRKVRESAGEFHVVKNTLAAIAMKQAGRPVPEEMLAGSTALGFAFSDVPGVAKAISDFAKDSEFVKVKGGVMGNKVLDSKQVNALASLPPLPVVRAQLLGLLNTPATRLAGIVASGVRQVVNVVKAYSEKSN
ncbi:MAG TPA: 50S ribosomal protein L10 [Anaerolineales bacterium]|nr:50S ribosomal protein L10 [Anaerolineales bacterium]